MTLNAEWLWTPFDRNVDGSKFNRGDMSQDAYLNELSFYVSLLKKNDIDLLAISEIENEHVAKDLANKMGQGWKAHFVQGRDTATGQDVALISRLSIVKDSLTNLSFPCGKSPKAKKRKCLSKVVAAQFFHPDDSASKFSVISAHFLSKRNDSKKKRLKRLSQSYALANAIRQLEEDYQKDESIKLIALGDFNDTANSAVLKHLREQNHLSSALDCPEDTQKNRKRRLKSIDHILFKGFACTKEYAIPTYEYSDHDAVVMVLK